MDDNVTQVLVLLITTIGTIAVAYIRAKRPPSKEEGSNG